MSLSPLSKHSPFLLQLIQVLDLFWFSCCFVAVSTIALPISVIVQFLAAHSLGKQLCFLPLLAQVHHTAKIVMYVILELLKKFLPVFQLDLRIFTVRIHTVILYALCVTYYKHNGFFSGSFCSAEMLNYILVLKNLTSVVGI